MLDLTVIILTYNEQANIEQALASLQGWADKVFILDAYSTDKTMEKAKSYPCSVFQNHFETYGKQRNYALKNLPIETEWVLFLDADEWLPMDLKNEISAVIASRPQEDGYYIKWRFIWMGRWIRRGYYPTWLLRLFRPSKARCEDRGVNEHVLLDGKAGYLAHDFVHEDRKSLSEWIDKHNKYAALEAVELFNRSRLTEDGMERFWGSQTQRKRWLRHRVWERLPPLIRPFLYFFYRYFIMGGILEGRVAFTYHFLQALWFPMLIDMKYLELKWRGAPFASPDHLDQKTNPRNTKR